MSKIEWTTVNLSKKLALRIREVMKWFDFKSVADFVSYAVREELKKRELSMEVQKSQREGYNGQ